MIPEDYLFRGQDIFRLKESDTRKGKVIFEDVNLIIKDGEVTRMINFASNLILDFEKDSDRRISAICRVITVLIMAVILLNMLHVFKISTALYPTLIVSAVILLLPTLFYDILHWRSKFIRYVVLTLLVFMSGLMYSILSYHVIIMLILPVVVSCLYCERANVIYTTVLSVPVMVISHLIAYKLKIVPDEPLVTLRGVLLYGILPRVIELVAISVICIGITGKLQRLITALVKKIMSCTKNSRLWLVLFRSLLRHKVMRQVSMSNVLPHTQKYYVVQWDYLRRKPGKSVWQV